MNLYPKHDCKPKKREPKEGMFVSRLMPNFSQCPDCYKQLDLTEEQVRNKLELLDIALKMVEKKKEDKKYEGSYGYGMDKR